MKKTLNKIIASIHIKKLPTILKENKKLIITTLIVVLSVDIFFIPWSSDTVIFSTLLLYGIFTKIVSIKSKATFLLCLALLIAMFFSYVFTGPSIPTEKAAVWLVLFMAFGIFQQWKELDIKKQSENNQSGFISKIKNLPFVLFMRFSSTIYFLLGPTVSFKLAMSPFGKKIIQLIIRKKKFITAKTKYDFLMYMHTYEYFMSGYLFMGETNPYETWVLRKMLKKDDIFFDVGAHIGWYALNAAQVVGKKGKVITFEPNPNCLVYLKKNKQLNNFDNMSIESIALASKNTRVDFWVGDDMGGALIKENTMRLTIDKQVKKIVVMAQTLDDYCKKHRINKIDVMKIDVEGAEMQVLKGAKMTLKTLSPDIIIESTDETLQKDNTSRGELFSFFRSNGYFPYVFTPVGLKPYTLDQIQPTINVYFSKKRSFNGYTK